MLIAAIVIAVIAAAAAIFFGFKKQAGPAVIAGSVMLIAVGATLWIGLGNQVNNVGNRVNAIAATQTTQGRQITALQQEVSGFTTANCLGPDASSQPGIVGMLCTIEAQQKGLPAAVASALPTPSATPSNGLTSDQTNALEISAATITARNAGDDSLAYSIATYYVNGHEDTALALAAAVNSGHVKIAEALASAAANGDRSVASALMKDINASNWKAATPLATAYLNGDTSTVQALLANS